MANSSKLSNTKHTAYRAAIVVIQLAEYLRGRLLGGIISKQQFYIVGAKLMSLTVKVVNSLKRDDIWYM